MSFHLWPTSLLIGQYDSAPDSSWYENDGIVNSVSMSHPFGSDMVHFDGNPITGVWQSLERINMDHQAIIGHNISSKQKNYLVALYNKHCNLLYAVQ